MWMAETLWRAPALAVAAAPDVPEADRRRALETAAALMRASVDGRPRAAQAGARPRRAACARCGTPIALAGQGDANRIAYWCPACQPG